MAQREKDKLWPDELTAIGLEPGRALSSTAEIDAPAETVWQRITEPGHLRHCHPFCASNVIERWPGAGARDRIKYYSGREYVRNFLGWFEDVGYDIELGDRPEATARVRWRISATPESTSQLSIEVIPYLRSAQSKVNKAEYQSRLFGQDLKQYLECVTKGVAFWVVTGQDVVKDQFGANPLYSG